MRKKRRSAVVFACAPTFGLVPTENTFGTLKPIQMLLHNLAVTERKVMKFGNETIDLLDALFRYLGVFLHVCIQQIGRIKLLKIFTDFFCDIRDLFFDHLFFFYSDFVVFRPECVEQMNFCHNKYLH